MIVGELELRILEGLPVIVGLSAGKRAPSKQQPPAEQSKLGRDRPFALLLSTASEFGYGVLLRTVPFDTI